MRRTDIETFRQSDMRNVLNCGQRYAYDTMMHVMASGSEKPRNTLLMGDAGTGKSFEIDAIVGSFEANGLSVAKMAYMGVTAERIGGVTVNSAFKVGIGVSEPRLNDAQKENARNVISKMDLIVIDEISLVPSYLLDIAYLQLVIANQVRKSHNKPPVRLLFIGDFAQLIPVVDRDEEPAYKKIYGGSFKNGFCFEAKCWDALDIRPLFLDEIMRQKDAEFSGMLAKIRNGNVLGVYDIEAKRSKTVIEDAPWICGFRKTVAKINGQHLAKLPGKLTRSEAEISGRARIGQTNLEKTLEFKKDARVMMLQNTEYYKNGTLGYIDDINEITGEVRIRLDDGATVSVNKIAKEVMATGIGPDGNLALNVVGAIRQYPFMLAWAMTIHKAQGITLKAVNIVPEFFEKGQLYVAISRATSVENIYVEGRLDVSDVKICKQARDFISDMRDKFGEFKIRYPEMPELQ